MAAAERDGSVTVFPSFLMSAEGVSLQRVPPMVRRAGSLLLALSIASALGASELEIAPAVLTNGDYGTRFQRVITVTGGTPPYTALTIPGFDANSTGVAAPVIDLNAGTVTFDSTPTNYGGFSFTVAVTDSAGASASRNYDVLINYRLGFNPPFIVGEGSIAYGLQVHTQLAEGTPPYTSLEVLDFDDGGTGADPPVAHLATGRVDGNSAVHSDGIVTFRVRGTDSAGGVADQLFRAYVDSGLHFTPKMLPPGDAGVPYGAVLIATGGSSPGCQDIGVTSFDDGGTGLSPPTTNPVECTLHFDSTPTAAGTATVGVHVTNSAGTTFHDTYEIVIHPEVTITPAVLPEGTAGEPYEQVVTVNGGLRPFKLIRLHTWSPGTGIPTPAIDLATGTITFSGTPPASSLLNFSVTAYDSANGSAFQEFTLFVASPLSITPATLLEGEAGQHYQQLIHVEGGSPPFTTFTVNAFDAGGTGLAAPMIDPSSSRVTFDSTPASAGTATFTIDVIDSHGRALTKSCSIVIHPPLAITPQSLPDGVAGKAYHQVITISGGITPYSGFTVAFDGGDTGLANPTLDLDAGTITLSGTPNAPGIARVWIHNHNLLVRSYTFAVHLLSAPSSVVAAATGATVVVAQWSASAGASVYEVERSADGMAYVAIGQTASLTFTDDSGAANTAYLYRIRAIAPATSPSSAPDLATTVIFTDSSLALKPIRALHFTQMRTAVNAVRQLAGLSAFAFNNTAVVKAVHLTELRDALAPARAVLGLAPLTFARPNITPRVTKIFAVDLHELRDGVR